MLPLSRKQAEVLREIDRFARREGRMPSVRELGERLKRTAATVQQHLDALERKGLVTRDGTAHGLRRIEAPLRLGGEGGGGRRAGEAVALPVVGRIAAGAPIEAIENRLAEVWVPDAPPGSYALVVRGDSMIEDHIVDGDLVVIRPAQVVRQGAVAVCLLEDGSATLKRVYREKSRVRLQPANRALPPLYVKDVRIQGELFAVWRVTR
ncbi:MAG TPA: transcriptional repressor LexA [Myxococcota bacterium]|nr:transcriptional repressor LexA [Myxococcota bacterium]